MNARLVELAEHRAALIAQAEGQRHELARFHARFRAPFGLAETCMAFGRTLRSSPWLVTGLTALLVRTPWRKLGRMPRWAWRGWKFFQFVRNWIV